MKHLVDAQPTLTPSPVDPRVKLAQKFLARAKVDPDLRPFDTLLNQQGFSLLPKGKFDEPEPKFLLKDNNMAAFAEWQGQLKAFEPNRPLITQLGLRRLENFMRNKPDILVSFGLECLDDTGRAIAFEEDMIVRYRISVRDGKISGGEFTAKTMDQPRHAHRPRQEFSDTDATSVTHIDPFKAHIMSYRLFEHEVMSHAEFPPALKKGFKPHNVRVTSINFCNRANYSAVHTFQTKNGRFMATIIDACNDWNIFAIPVQNQMCEITLQKTGMDGEHELELKRIAMQGNVEGFTTHQCDQHVKFAEDRLKEYLKEHSSELFIPNRKSKIERADDAAYRYLTGGNVVPFNQAAQDRRLLLQNSHTLAEMFKSKAVQAQIIAMAQEVEQIDFVSAISKRAGIEVVHGYHAPARAVAAPR